MKISSIRVRFAPSPTGFMHLGNVRAALLNYLFAQQHEGTFILRIEDTDLRRNRHEAALQIIKDLEWLKLSFDEGPVVGGAYGPYAQSERMHLYQEKLDLLIENGLVYRCFCTPELLEQKREQQLAHGKPPRYDRACRALATNTVTHNLNQKLPFVWRFELNDNQRVDIHDMARTNVSFELSHFSDPVIARNDGSFMFIFANFVDDWLMGITHVIRGEDHLSNTALQAALYLAFDIALPTFWHLPMICNQAGQKLSKRDFGFALNDLQEAGFLPEAICSYLTALGTSTDNETQSLAELVKSYNFNHVPSGGAIKYDLDKLRWVNHQWIAKLALDDLYQRIGPRLHAAYPSISSCPPDKIKQVLEVIKPELYTLNDCVNLFKFYFEEPEFDVTKLENEIGAEPALQAAKLIGTHVPSLHHNQTTFVENLKQTAREQKISTKALFVTLRYALTGNLHGMSINDLMTVLSPDQIKHRLGRIQVD